MEIFEAKMMTDGTLSGKDDLTILKPEDTVVTMQLVEKTEISVVKVVQGGKEGKGNEVMENVKEGYFGNLVDGDGYDGMGVNVNMVQDGKEGKGNEVTVNVKEGYFGNLVDVDGHDGMGINVNMVQDDKEGEGNEVMDDEKEGYFGNLFDCDGDDGMGVNVNMVQDGKEGEGNEVIEDEKEGYFGNLADGMGVNANRVQDGKEGEGNEVMENLKEGYFGNLVDVDGQDGMDVDCGENGTSQAMDVEGSLADQNNENGTKIFDDENIEKLEEFHVEFGENEKEDHNFVVGDFVWGKFKTHPWWPGRIYSPSDASDIAARLNPKGRLLVAYFGDGSFSWSSPSQLKPFIHHFPEMSSQTDSKKFVNAVKISLEEVSRLVEAGLMCKCQTVSRTGSVGNFGNRGIKKGVPVPKGNMVKVLVDRMEPVELLLSLKDAAMTDPGARLTELELVLLKSCLNVFYGKKGEYHDPMCIEGLEDDTRNGVVTDCPSGSIDDGADKLYQGRKQKSVMELLGEDELKSKKTKTTKDGGSGKRKRKALVVSVTPESDHESGGGGGVEDSMSPRQRKKSKYLSPPYLSPVGSGKLSALGLGSGSFKEPKPEPEKVLETAAKHLDADPQEQKKTIDIDVNVNKVLHGLLSVALDPTSFAEKTLHTVADFILYYRSSIFEEASSYPTERKKTTGYASNLAVTKQKLGSGRKKNGADTSELAVIKQKLEWMLETVKGCEETKMNADVKASLEGGIQEVLQKVGKMKGK